RAYASQAAAYVVCAAGLRLKSHIPDRYKRFDQWEHAGHSAIIDPRGEIIAGPVEGETILMAEASLDTVRAAKAAVDIAGHYSRPDIFDLQVDDTPREGSVRFTSDGVFDEPAATKPAE
ncbi:MAG: nitrilase-related carbon-nitrogen hydrolase, partial [Pseudomonadota bacterium]